MQCFFKLHKRGAARAAFERLSRQIFGYRQSEVELVMPALDPYDLEGWWDGDLQRERRPVAIKIGCNIPGFVPVAPAPEDVQNALMGIKKRVGRKLPACDDALARRFDAFVDKWLKQNLTPLRAVMDFEPWLDTTNYNLARKEQLRKVHDILHGAPCPKHVRRKIACFLKAEQYASTTEGFKYARWIMSRSDYFKAYSGRYFKSIEQEVYKIRHFIKHVPVADRPKLIAALKQAGASYLSTDYKSFEAHFVSKFMHMCECKLYRYMLSKCDRRAAEVICKTIEAEAEVFGTNVLKTRSGVHAEIEGRRMSGDMCTSLGNGFTNLMLWSFFAEENGCEWDGYVEGDDGIFAVYKGHAPSAEQFAKLGWTIKIETHQDVEKAGFCGCKYVAGYNVRDPVSVFCTFGWSMTNVDCSSRTARQLLRAKAMSLLVEMPQCPIIGALARYAMQITEGVRPKFVNDGYHEFSQIEEQSRSVTAYAPPQELRQFFAQEYGIAEEVQCYLEKEVFAGNLEAISACVPAPAASLIMERMYSCG